MAALLLALALFPVFAPAQPFASLSNGLDSLFQSHFKPNEPGAAVLIAKNGQVLYQKGFGVADMDNKTPITPHTLFNIGSISKTFVAFGILQLAREGKLSIDDPVSKYFPDFKNKAIADKVKIHHLLTHTSGLPDSRPVARDSVFYLSAKDAANFEPIKQTEQLHFEPGERFEYSNPAFNGLALIIEKVTGQPWQRYIRQRIFKPSGMAHSTITNGPHPRRGVSHGYLPDGKGGFMEKDYGEEPTFAAAGNGGVWSSVEELWQYEQAIQHALFLPAAQIERSRTVYPYQNWKAEEPPFIGLCWFLTTDQGQRLIGHTGFQGGFVSDYVWLPEKDIFYVLLCNIPQSVTALRHEVFAHLEKQNWLGKK